MTLLRRLLLSMFCGTLLATLAGYADAQAPANTATKPAPRPQEGWKKRHESFVERAKKGKVDVLFVGDSITQGWEGNGKDVWKEKFTAWNPANFGIGGDKTEHVLWRITEGKELEGIEPKVVVIMIGTNNMGANSASEIADGVTAIVKEFRKTEPQAKILLLGIFPRAGKAMKDATVVPAADLMTKVNEVNEKIAKLDDGKSVHYLDISKKFLNSSGGLEKSIMYDYLHLTPEGYKIWAEAITKPVNDLLGEKK